MQDTPKREKRRFWVTLLAVGLGAFIGAGVYTFSYAEGASYLSNDPAACINCHVMQPHYDTWSRSSHAAVATCNDCHAPHDNFLHKYQSKAMNGLNHSWKFTTGNFPDRILITETNRRILEASCRHCHEAITTAIDPVHGVDGGLSCLRCHDDVAHGP
ncbi:MAG: cytochrome c nitrite reductase small subunit [Planctomycetota bacterium]